MATRTVCDGCECVAKDDEVTTVGRYDPCVFCPMCLAKWRTHEAAERVAHAEVVRAFEARRAAALAGLKAAGFARLPDED